MKLNNDISKEEIVLMEKSGRLDSGYCNFD
jgi:hypothetical protein